MQGLDHMLGASGMDLGSLGSRFGLTPEQTASAMSSLMPAINGGFQKTAQSGNLAGVENAAAGVDQPDTGAGNDILGHIFGSKDVSRQVADHASGQSGVSSQVLKAMLPIVAAMAAKHMAGSGGGGGLGSILGSLAGTGGAGGLGGLLGGASAGGNPLDDILGRMR